MMKKLLSLYGIRSYSAAGCMVGASVLLALGSGCSWFEPKVEVATRPAGTLNQTTLLDASRAAAIQGTVASVASLRGTRLMSVRGYGLVYGLSGKGSANCSPRIREYIVKEILRQRAARTETRTDELTPDAMITSMDTAVVMVEADVPAGAPAGRIFDVTVRALDPDIVSLAGGILMSCELKIYKEVTPESIIEGRTHAKANGQIFINPFAQGDSSSTSVNLREGKIIGGGVNTVDRRMRLVTTVESYSTVRQVQDAINQRFGGQIKIADAVSPTTVNLSTPVDYFGREKRFLDLLMHLPISTSSVNREGRAKLLVTELSRPDAPLEDVSLSLEGIGKSVLPMIQPLYTHPRREVSYFAARTGLRLGDDLAIEVMIRHAQDGKNLYRRQAIDELAYSPMIHRAANSLRELLADPDVRIRILAYESLRRLNTKHIKRYMVGREPENFVLDVVESPGPPMIYARRTQARRIALIGGEQMVCLPPFLCTDAGQRITLSANSSDRAITAIRKDGAGKTLAGPLPIPLPVSLLTRFLGENFTHNLDGALEGLGLDYSTILQVLYQLAEKGAIQAEVRWEEPSIEDITGPLEPLGRPETDL